VTLDRGRMRDLFEAVCDMPAAERSAYLDRACAGDAALRAELDSLLASDAVADDAFSEQRMSHIPAMLGHAALPERIGRYRIVRLIGAGGMGDVYEAEQDSPRRSVALKVIRGGSVSRGMLRRFTHESQVLGRLQHPGIAQIYEAGTVEDERGGSLPFFAMEFIRGVPITQFAKDRGLGTRERLDLIAKICDAVSHAHQKGVIHRDLKPGNILVDETGQPKVLDFGIARATESDLRATTLQTDVGQLIGTIPYMSPEQVSGDPSELDTRSDVYALGVLAYELLAGRLPHDLARRMIHEAARVIREEEPTRLSSINRALRGDVETIITKALEKDKTRRYQSAESLASDLRRYLKDEPIAARPASSWYQTTKFARRNKGLVTGLVVAFALLVAGLIGTLYGLRQAVAARDDAAQQARQAQKEAEISLAVAESLRNVFYLPTPNIAQGKEPSLREAIDQTAESLDDGFKGPPEAEAIIRNVLGIVYRNYAEYDKSRDELERALAIRREALAPDHLDIADSLHNLALLLSVSGHGEESLPLFAEALEIQRRVLGPDDTKVARSLYNLARATMRQKKFDEALALMNESLDLHRRVMADNKEIIGMHVSTMASILRYKGDFTGAEARAIEAVEIMRDSSGPDSLSCGVAQLELGMIRLAAGNLPGADEASADALRIIELVFANKPEHPTAVTARDERAKVLRAMGRDADADALLARGQPPTPPAGK
jgi:eukaryotic-like serine/threonine-protein kinase